MRREVGSVSGTAVPTGAGHCAPHDGIEPWEQHASQSFTSESTGPPQAWVSELPIPLGPSVAAYVSTGPCRTVARSIRMEIKRRRIVLKCTVSENRRNENWERLPGNDGASGRLIATHQGFRHAEPKRAPC